MFNNPQSSLPCVRLLRSRKTVFVATLELLTNDQITPCRPPTQSRFVRGSAVRNTGSSNVRFGNATIAAQLPETGLTGGKALLRNAPTDARLSRPYPCAAASRSDIAPNVTT